MSITESELVKPALLAMASRGGCIDTTTLISVLREMLNPQGEDLEILAGRQDDKFSQKVRNLKSHDTLVKNGYATYNAGIFCITESGRQIIL